MNSDNTNKNDRAEGILKDCNKKEADPLTHTVQILDNINRQIKAAERRLNEQRGGKQ